ECAGHSGAGRLGGSFGLGHPGDGLVVLEAVAGDGGGLDAAGEAVDPGLGQPGQIVGVGCDGGDDAVRVDPAVGASGGVDRGPDDGVAVSGLDDLDTAAVQLAGPGESFGDPVEANAGDAVVAA